MPVFRMNLIHSLILIILVAHANGEESTVCDQLDENKWYDSSRVLINIYIDGTFSCRAVLINHITTFTSEHCVHENTDPSAVTARTDPPGDDYVTATIVTELYDGSVVVTFDGRLTDKSFGAGGNRTHETITPDIYLERIGSRQRAFPRINYGVYSSQVCIISKSGDHVAAEMASDTSPCTAVYEHDYCFVVNSPTGDLLGQTVLAIDDFGVSYIKGLVVHVQGAHATVSKVDDMTYGVGCLEQVSGYWMDHPDHYINDQHVDFTRAKDCQEETWKLGWPTQGPCGVHPAICQVPVTVGISPNDASCPAESLLRPKKDPVLCCNRDQDPLPHNGALTCFCNDFALKIKCPW